MIEILVFGGKPEAVNRDDFGGPDDYGLCLRRKGVNYSEPVPIDADCFGVFQGHSHEGAVVGVQDLMSWEVTRYQVYDSLAELKTEWELD